MILKSNVDYMWSTVVKPRIGVAPYAFGGSFDPNNVTVGTDCSGAVSAELEALLYGPAMVWQRQFWTGTFAGAVPGQSGPFGGVACTAELVCIASPDAAPADAAMIIAVLQNPDATAAHMICQVQGINIEMGGPTNSYVMGPQATDIRNPEFNQWFYLPGPIMSPVQGIDYSTGPPGGAAIKAAGYSFACRYVTDGLAQLPNKELTAVEANDLWANGVDVVSNWEATATNALNGFGQGVTDAQAAQANHLAAGGPPMRPIYFSVDFDEAQSQDPQVDAYFQGVASVIGLARTGAYGGYWVVKRLFDAGLITWGWQAEAWSGDPAGLAPAGPDGDYLDPRANILQRNAAGFVTVNGVQCDLDEALTPDFGQWHYTGGTPVTAPDYTRLAYEQLAGPVQADGYGHGWSQLGNLTVVDALAAVKSMVTDLEQRSVTPPQTPPTPTPVTPPQTPPIPTPVTPPGTITINTAQILRWTKDIISVIGAIATWATAAHNVLGQFLPGASGVAVPLGIALVDAGFTSHTVRQRNTAVETLKGK